MHSRWLTVLLAAATALTPVASQAQGFGDRIVREARGSNPRANNPAPRTDSGRSWQSQPQQRAPRGDGGQRWQRPDGGQRAQPQQRPDGGQRWQRPDGGQRWQRPDGGQRWQGSNGQQPRQGWQRPDRTVTTPGTPNVTDGNRVPNRDWRNRDGNRGRDNNGQMSRNDRQWANGVRGAIDRGDNNNWRNNPNNRYDNNRGRYDNNRGRYDYDRGRYDNNRGRYDNNRGRYDNHGRYDNRRWDRQWRNNNRYNWQSYRASNRNVYRLGRYYSPYDSWSYRRLSIGFSLMPLFYSDRYWINDPWTYRLPDAYGSYRWIRYYNDALLVDSYSGEVVDVMYDFFW